MKKPLLGTFPSGVALPKSLFHNQPILVFIGLLIYFGGILFLTDRLSGNDSYFHIKYAWMLWKEGGLRDFPWLQGTPFKDIWIDHEFLYHLLLIPFTWLGDLIIAAKAAAAFWAATALFASYLLIRMFGNQDPLWQRFAWIWPIVIAASSSPMLHRLTQTRVQSVSLLFLLAALILMEKERDRWLLPLGFFYAWLYNGAVILIPVTVLFALTRRVPDRRRFWNPCLSAASGLILGFVLNPYFPDNLVFLWKHLREYLLLPTPVPVSLEWVDYSSWSHFDASRGAWILLVTGILALAFHDRTWSRRSLAYFFINLLFLVMSFRARRFVEYWPVFAALFNASALQESRLSLLARMTDSFPKVSRENWKLFQYAVSSGLMVVLSVAALISAQRVLVNIRENAPVDRFAQAADWLQANTAKDSIVFNAQWDAFPELFFHDHHNRWIAGLNEAFVYYQEPRLWYLYRGIADGTLSDTARLLKQHFLSDHLLTLKQFQGVVEAAENPDNGLELAWEDGHTAIYRVRPSDRFFQIEGEFVPPPALGDNRLFTCRRKESSECRDYGNPSAGAFLLCEGQTSEAKLSWIIQVPSAGVWKVEGRFPQGPGMGSMVLRINGQTLGKSLSLQSPSNNVGPFHALGELALGAGPARVEADYALPAAKNRAFFGLDALRFTRLSTPSATK